MKIDNETPTRKSLGQHWLNDAPTLEDICSAADIKPGDMVLEIGPGTGSLTKVILSKGADLIALELDAALVNSLELSFANEPKLKIEQGDIRSYDLSKMPEKYKVVANIPYYLTAYLLRLLTDAANKPEVVVILVQKEVAQRVAASKGQSSFISLATQFYYETSLGQVVPAKMFTPPPKVDSQVLILKKLNKPKYEDLDPQKFLHFIKAGFSQPRKTIINSLRGALQVDKASTTELVISTGLSEHSRAQELSFEDWHKLYLKYNT